MTIDEYTIKVTQTNSGFWWTIYHRNAKDAESVFSQDSFLAAFQDAVLLLEKRAAND